MKKYRSVARHCFVMKSMHTDGGYWSGVRIVIIATKEKWKEWHHIFCPWYILRLTVIVMNSMSYTNNLDVKRIYKRYDGKCKEHGEMCNPMICVVDENDLV